MHCCSNVLLLICLSLCIVIAAPPRSRQLKSSSDDALVEADILLKNAGCRGDDLEKCIGNLRHIVNDVAPEHIDATEELVKRLVERVASGKSSDLQGDVFKDPDRAEDLVEAEKAIHRLMKFHLGNAKKHAQRWQSFVMYFPNYLVDVGGRIEGGDRPLCALMVYKLALLIDANHFNAMACVYKVKEFLCDWKGREKTFSKIMEVVNKQIRSGDVRSSLQPLTAVSQDVGPELELQIAATWATFYKQLAPKPGFASPHSALLETKRIRIGYLSADFRRHAVTWLVQNTLEEHKRRDKMSIIAFSTNPRGNNNVYAQSIAKIVTSFIEAERMNDRELAARINEEKIHVLVEMGGHTGGNRLQVVAQNPAPVSVLYLGYPATTGADYVQYFVADAVAITPEIAQHFSEKIGMMPLSYYPTNPSLTIGPTPIAESVGLPKNADVVFTCFNRNLKIKPKLFEKWMAILKHHPRAVLWLRRFHFRAQENLLQQAKKFGINETQLIFAGGLGDKSQHIARHNLGDLFLDTFGFNGHSTIADALLTGMAALTLPHSTLASRISSSLMLATKETGATFVARTLDDYEMLGLRLANKKREFWTKTKRKMMEHKDQQTGVFNIPLYTENLEKLYRTMLDKTMMLQQQHQNMHIIVHG